MIAEMTLLLATRNAHKISEIRAILGDRFGYLSLQDFPGAPEVLENENTFQGNATKKSIELAKWLSAPAVAGQASRLSRGRLALEDTNGGETPGRIGGTPAPLAAAGSEMFVLADDSGLEVDALNGAP